MRKLIESYNNGYGPGNGGNGNGAPGSGNNGGNGNNSNGGNGNGSPKRPSILMLILSGLMTVIVVLMLYNAFFGTNTGTEVSYTDFLKDLEADKVAAVEVRAMPRYMYRRRPALHSRMWPVKTKQRNLWWKSWTSCIIHRNIPRSVQNCPREHCWWALPEPVRLCWPRQWQGKHMYRSSL